MKSYKFLKDCKFSNNGYLVVEAKKGEEHEVDDKLVASLAKQGAIASKTEAAEPKKKPVEKRVKKVVEPTEKK